MGWGSLSRGQPVPPVRGSSWRGAPGTDGPGWIPARWLWAVLCPNSPAALPAQPPGTAALSPASQGPGEPGLWSDRAVVPENLLLKDCCPPAAATTSQIQLPSQVDVRSKTCSLITIRKTPNQGTAASLSLPALPPLTSEPLLPFHCGSSP